ncbi:hypothetical protein B0O80DRAFT_503176 [Mortierella sp. GBAus27b]|nr:hypothetical protein B0O80DRAFT_503176 [Mortierella sp. GBAus27b]
MTHSGEVSLSLPARDGGLVSEQENDPSDSQGLSALDFSGLSESDDEDMGPTKSRGKDTSRVVSEDVPVVGKDGSPPPAMAVKGSKEEEGPPCDHADCDGVAFCAVTGECTHRTCDQSRYCQQPVLLGSKHKPCVGHAYCDPRYVCKGGRPRKGFESAEWHRKQDLELAEVEKSLESARQDRARHKESGTGLGVAGSTRIAVRGGSEPLAAGPMTRGKKRLVSGRESSAPLLSGLDSAQDKDKPEASASLGDDNVLPWHYHINLQ